MDSDEETKNRMKDEMDDDDIDPMARLMMQQMDTVKELEEKAR